MAIVKPAVQEKLHTVAVLVWHGDRALGLLFILNVRCTDMA
jgi:hypothetical protein